MVREKDNTDMMVANPTGNHAECEPQVCRCRCESREAARPSPFAARTRGETGRVIRADMRQIRRFATRDWGLLDLLLEPLRSADARRLGSAAAIERARPAGADRILAVLIRHKLHLLFREAVHAAGLVEALPPEAGRHLDELNRLALARSLAQERGTSLAIAAFGAEAIPWVAFKGAHLSRALYDPAHIRLADDVDLLIRAEDRSRALRCLEAAGFAVSLAGPNTTHEVSVAGFGASIDLHTALLRPGRTRTELGARLLRDRKRLGGIWVPSDPMALAVMLIHPAITEHVTCSLARVVDVDRWLRQHGAEAALTSIPIVRAAGVEPAAWSMLYWTRLWMGTPEAGRLDSELRVSHARRAYLASWLATNPYQQYERSPTWVRLGFSLALQDSWRDMARSLRMRARGMGRWLT